MLRYNEGKSQLSMLPHSFYVSAFDQIGLHQMNRRMVREITSVLEYGADKYTTEARSGRNNWRASGNWTKVADSALRHLMATDEVDEESGLSHMAHFGCNIIFLIEFTTNNLGQDDRHKVYDRHDQFPFFTTGKTHEELIILYFTYWLDGGADYYLDKCLELLNDYYEYLPD